MLSDGFGHPGRGLVPVLLEDDQDMEEGIRRQIELYEQGMSRYHNLLMSHFYQCFKMD